MTAESILYRKLLGNMTDTKSTAYRDVIVQKVKQKYTESIPTFSQRFNERFTVNSISEAQCRLCGLKAKLCCKIFEGDGTLCKLVNTYMPITVSDSDGLPLNVCLECLGILQSIDDLAYRCYLVEGCLLEHYKDYKDTSIFLDKTPKKNEKPYEPLAQLPEAKDTLHPAATLGFPVKKKGRFVKNLLTVAPKPAAKSTKSQKAAQQISISQVQTGRSKPYAPEVVKNTLKANLHKILLGGGSSKVKLGGSLSTPRGAESGDDHDYSASESSPVKQEEVMFDLGVDSSSAILWPQDTGSDQQTSNAEAVRNLANAALAELDKNASEDSTLLNLSEILNKQSHDLDEPVYIILVNDEEKETAVKPEPELIALAVDPLDVPNTSSARGVKTNGVSEDADTAIKPEKSEVINLECDENLGTVEQNLDDDCQFLQTDKVQVDFVKDVNSQAVDLSSAEEQINAGVNPDEELVKFSESLQTEQIKKWYAIQILKTSTENDEDKEENQNKEDGDDTLLVTYVVYYSKIDGRLVPHHFSLMNDSFSETTRRRAYSIIHTMLKEEKNRVLVNVETTQKKNVSKSPKLSTRVPPKKPFRTTCCFCNKTMKENELSAHILSSHMLRCKYCSVFYDSKDELFNHECEAHGKKSVECETCQKKFVEEEDKFFCSHNFICQICKKQFPSWTEFLRHEKVHLNSTALKFMREFKMDIGRSHALKNSESEKVLNFSCSTCGRRFETQMEMEDCDHLYKCQVCQNWFSNYPLFVTHGCMTNPDLLRIVGKKKIQKKVLVRCELCSVQFDSQKMYLSHYYSCMLKHGIDVDLNEEIKALQTNSPVKCVFCDESFKSIFIFELHYNQCFKTNSVECEDCEDILPVNKRGAHMLFCHTDALCHSCGENFQTKKLYRQHLRQQLDGSTICTATSEVRDVAFSGYISEGFDPNNCHMCGKMFVNGHTLDRHVKSVHLGLEKSCPLCGLKFQKHNSITTFLKHRKTHSEGELKEISSGESFGTYQCSTCDKWFASKLLKLLHELHYHKKVLHKCVRCETEFLNIINLKSHETKCKAQQKDKSVYTCEHCGEAFPKVILYYQHLETHDITYTCEECGKTFKKKTNLAKHKEVAHSNSPTICDVCGREFSCEKYCKIHKRNLHGDQSFLCQVCGKTFHNKKRLSLHASVHSGLKPYKCRYCDKHFRTHTIRNIHEDKHKNEYKYECNFCQHKFSRFINLYVHKRKVHADKCTYQCMKCGCGYNDEEFYNNHIKKCIGRKRKFDGNTRAAYCPYCDKTFGTTRLLKAHYSPSIDTGHLLCSRVTCGKRFDSECSLKSHEKVHAVDKHPCKLCGEAFLGMKQLELHSQLKHNETFAFHCSYCGRGYMFEKFYNKHVKYCNESLQQQLAYTQNKSKKPIVRCESCGKIFGKFKDLRVHMTLTHGSETYKDYQCLICDSKYDSYIQLSKHSKHHFKDPTNPGSYCCPKCKIFTTDWEVMMNHVCGNGLPKRGESSRFSNLDSKPIIDYDPHPRRKSPRKATPRYDSDDEYMPSQSIASYSGHHTEYDSIPSFSRADKRSKPSGRSYTSKPVVVKEDEFISDDEMQQQPLPNDDANLIYHCSFCSSNFDHIVTLQQHLTSDHNLSLNSLEFQLVE